MDDASTLKERLPKERAELRLVDAKPRYAPAEAVAEAHRCLYCHDAPCVKACPTSIDIPSFIKKIASGNVRGAAQTILEQNLLGASCARVCPVEVLCVGDCVYNEWHRAPIQIGKLQRFATESALEDEARTGRRLFVPKAPRGKKVAMIGAGPASLACAAHLALEGVETTLFERGALPGGLNVTGVAPYKLHAHHALDEVAWLLSHGPTTLKTGVEIGKDVKGAALLHDFDAVFLGVGLGHDAKLGVPGEPGPGVVGATAWIERMKNHADFTLGSTRRALVVGGGNTAIDVARELAQLGVRDVAMVYRRGLADMSGYRHELDGARREGVRLVEHARPVEVVREAGAVAALRVADAKTGEERLLPCDLVVVAIGQAKLRDVVAEFPDVALDGNGRVVVDARTRRTGNAKVWAGGDCINGGAEVVNAAADGREAARAMLRAWGM